MKNPARQEVKYYKNLEKLLTTEPKEKYWQKRSEQKKRSVEALMGSVTSEKFATMVAIGKMITDWTAPGELEAAAAGEAFRARPSSVGCGQAGQSHCPSHRGRR